MGSLAAFVRRPMGAKCSDTEARSSGNREKGYGDVADEVMRSGCCNQAGLRLLRDIIWDRSLDRNDTASA
jgi:hypothetical protein